jgi:transcriptional regulator with XRE-family HTH domain
MIVHRGTRLERFIKERGISLRKIQAAIPMHRTQLCRYRLGIALPSERVIARIVRAVRTLTGEPIKANQLFNLGDDDDQQRDSLESF